MRWSVANCEVLVMVIIWTGADYPELATWSSWGEVQCAQFDLWILRWAAAPTAADAVRNNEDAKRCRPCTIGHFHKQQENKMHDTSNSGNRYITRVISTICNWCRWYHLVAKLYDSRYRSGSPLLCTCELELESCQCLTHAVFFPGGYFSGLSYLPFPGDYRNNRRF